MKVTPTSLPEVKLIEPRIHRDERGSFQETFHAERYLEAGVDLPFVQHNQSVSEARVLRGLHAQLEQAQGKLIRVVSGEIFDVAVDIRRDSPTFLQWTSAVLSGESGHQLWIPAGFAHGFCVTGRHACIEYKCTEFYAPHDQLCMRWDDPEIAIRWPISDPLLSPQDRDAPSAREVVVRLPWMAWAGSDCELSHL